MGTASPIARRRPLLQVAVLLLLAGATSWGLLRFGATQQPALYGLFLFLLVPAVLVFLFSRNEPRPSRSWLSLLLVGILILGQVALRPTLAGLGFVHLGVGWLGLVLAFWLGASSRRAAQALVAFIVLIGLLEAAFALLELRGVVPALARHPEIQAHLAIGTLINPNHFAGLVNVCLVLALGMLAWPLAGGRAVQVRMAGAMPLVAGVALMAIAVWRAESRGAEIALIAAVAWTLALVALCWLPAMRAGLRTMRGKIVVGLLGAALAAVLALSVDRSGLLSLQDRGEIYRDTLTMIADQPVLGFGPGMYQWRFRPYQTVNLKGRYLHAHNDYLQSAAEWGVPAALLFWLFLGRRLLGAVRVWLDSPAPWARAVALGASAAIVTILVHSLVDFNLQIPGNLLLFALIVGLAWSLEREGSLDRAGPPSRSRRWLSRIVLPLLLLAAGIVVSFQLAALRQVGQEPDLDRLQRAVRLDPRNPDLNERLGLIYRDDLRWQDLEAAGVHLERAASLNPWAWAFQRELASLYQLRGLPDEAVAALRKAVDLNPRAAALHWQLANALLVAGSLDEAQPHFRFALAAPRGGRGYQRAALILLQASGATRQQIEAVWPEDPEARRWLESLLARGHRRSPGRKAIPD